MRASHPLLIAAQNNDTLTMSKQEYKRQNDQSDSKRMQQISAKTSQD